MAANIGGVVMDLALESAAFRRDIGKATSELQRGATKMRLAMRDVQRAANNVNRQVSQLRGAVVALAGALAVRQFSRFAKSALDTAGAIDDVAQRIGIATREFQRMQFAAGQTGVGMQALESSLERFVRRVGEARQGTGSFKDVARELGINLATPTAALADISNQIAATTDSAERARIAYAAFGRQGIELIPMLSGGAAGLRAMGDQAERLGAVMSDSLIAAAAKAGDNLEALRSVFGTTFNTAILQQLIESLRLTDDNLEAAAAAGRNFGEIVGASMKAVAEAGKFVARNLEEIQFVLVSLIALKAGTMFAAVAGAVVTFAVSLRSAAAAQGALNVVMAANPALRLAGAVAALGVAFLTLKPAAEGLEELQERLGAINDRLTTLRANQAAGARRGSMRAGLVNTEIAQLEKEAAALTKRLDELKKAAEAGAKGLATVGKTTSSASVKTTDFIKNLKLEVGQLRGLAEMTKLSAAAGRDFVLVMEQENAVKAAGIDETKKVTKANAEAAFEIRKLVAERAKLNKAIAQQNRIDEGRDRLTVLSKEAQLIGATTRERTVAVAILEKQLELQREGIDLTSKAAREEIELTKRIAETNAELEQATENRELFLEPFKNAIRGIQDSFTDMFESIFSGGVNSFSDLAAAVKRIFIRMAAEIASANLMRAVLGGAGGALGMSGTAAGASSLFGGGGLVGGGGVSGGGGFDAGSLLSLGGMANNAGLFGNTFSGIGTSLAGGINSFGASLGFGGFAGGAGPAAGSFAAAQQVGTSAVGSLSTAPLTSVLGGAGLGFGAGTLLNSLVGGNETGGMIGSAGGAVAGAIIGSIVPGIGTILGGLIGGAGGGLLGGLFGGGTSVGPAGGATFRVDRGAMARFWGSGGDNGFDPSGIASTVRQTVEDINTLLGRLGGTTFGRSLLLNLESFASQGGIRTGLHLREGGSSGAEGFRITTFGEDAQAAIADLVIKTFRHGDPQGIAPEIAAAIRNTRAKTLEAFVSDLEFAQSIAGMTNTVSAFDQAMAAVDQRFAEMTDRARSLGLSLDQVNAARERERQAVSLQFRAPFIAAAETIAGFLRTSELQFASPADQISAAQSQFGNLLGRVRGGEVGMTGSLLQTAQSLIGVSRSHFASTVDFQGIDGFVRSSLASLGETLTSDEFFDAQVAATQQQTEALSGGSSLADIEAGLDALRNEFRQIRQALAA